MKGCTACVTESRRRPRGADADGDGLRMMERLSIRYLMGEVLVLMPPETYTHRVLLLFNEEIPFLKRTRYNY